MINGFAAAFVLQEGKENLPCLNGEYFLWQKERIQLYSSVKAAAMNLQNGWDNVRDADSGIHLWKRRRLQAAV